MMKNKHGSLYKIFSVSILFLFLHRKVCYAYSLESLQQCNSNVDLDIYFPGETGTVPLESLSNTVHYKMVLDIRRFKYGSQKCCFQTKNV